MAIFVNVLGVLRDPVPTLRHIKRTVKWGEAWLVLIAGLVIAGIVSAIAAVITSKSADVANIFFQTLAYDTIGSLITFVAFVFVAHWFFRTLEHRGEWKKLFVLETYPFVTVKILTVVFGALATLSSGGSTTLNAGTIIGFIFTFFVILLVVYGLMLYILAARENYGASLAQTTIVILVAALLTFYVSLLSLLNLAGLTGGSPTG